jgi:hypothetical protein
MAHDPYHFIHSEARLAGELVLVIHRITRSRDLTDDATETHDQQGRKHGGDQQFDQGEAGLV